VLRRSVESALRAAGPNETADQVQAGLPRGHVHGVTHEGSFHVIGHGPADDSARGQVDHRRQIDPPFPRAHIGDVAGPSGVERQVLRAEVPRSRLRALASGSAKVVQRDRRLQRPASPAWIMSRATRGTNQVE